MPMLTMLLSRLVARQARQRTERALQQLTDRQLVDIGVVRADIPLVADRSVAPAPRQAEATAFSTDHLPHAWPA
jgi:uncharacterized protein YjiS (DUF1127 family)